MPYSTTMHDAYRSIILPEWLPCHLRQCCYGVHVAAYRELLITITSARSGSTCMVSSTTDAVVAQHKALAALQGCGYQLQHLIDLLAVCLTAVVLEGTLLTVMLTPRQLSLDVYQVMYTTQLCHVAAAGVLVAFAYLYMRPFVRRGLGSAHR